MWIHVRNYKDMENANLTDFDHAFRNESFMKSIFYHLSYNKHRAKITSEQATCKMHLSKRFPVSKLKA